VLTAVLAMLSLDRMSAPTSSPTTGRQRHDVREPDLDLGPP
jgi:hypothetical protein